MSSVGGIELTEDRDVVASLRSDWFGRAPAGYWLTRFLFLRGIGFIYAVAFLVLVNQWAGLIGSRGILPAAAFLERNRGRLDWLELPSLFWWNASDASLRACAWLGLALALAVVCGVENAFVMAALWALYLSFCHVGQIFYGYGWELQLLETGFIAIFLCPLRGFAPLHNRVTPSPVVIWLVRWILFRVMLGAGLIKIRGDACWRDLTCLAYFYETQPVPSPLSWVIHQAPLWFHQLGVVFNHLVELVAPWFVLGPRPARHAAGALIVAFQAILIATGNLSFLNWLTLVAAIACFDDGLLVRILPTRIGERAAALERERVRSPIATAVSLLLACAIGVLSLGPVLNMFSREQLMNTSFDPFHIVNSYGAFGSIGKHRDEVIVEGTRETRLGPNTHWEAYEFKCKPGDVKRMPCQITPYHYRLDWQMWFAALSDLRREPWFLRFVYKLLMAEPVVRGLLARDPFGAAPPRFIRAERYAYRFTRCSELRAGFWHRERLGVYMRPVARDDAELREFLEQRGWLEADEDE